jgi:23S rRNA pseudouridine2604 synthase
MADSPRKPLGLPPRAQADEAPACTGRRPVRGVASKRKSAADAAQVNAAYAAKARAQQEKPRGTPSRAPVAPKSPFAVRKPSPAPVAENGVAPSGVRISKLMAERGLCSRRDADGYIERGWVFVDGLRVTELGTRADPSVKITLAREAQIQQTWQMTILLHKPVGYVSGQPEPGFTPAVTLIQPETQFGMAETPAFHPRHLKGLAPAGRLDIDSTGLLVLTQDGRVARQLIGEDSQVDKEYLVRVEGRLDAAGLALLNHGLSLDDRKLKPAKVEWLNEDQLRFVLREGRKRQIRRMCELVGLHVVGLKRVRIGGVKLGDLPLGQWRFLRADERF